MTSIRICKGCHRPQDDARPLCAGCFRLASCRAEAVGRQDAAKDPWGKKRALVMASRRDRRAQKSKGGPKGQALARPLSLMPVGDEGPLG